MLSLTLIITAWSATTCLLVFVCRSNDQKWFFYQFLSLCHYIWEKKISELSPGFHESKKETQKMMSPRFFYIFHKYSMLGKVKRTLKDDPRMTIISLLLSLPRDFTFLDFLTISVLFSMLGMDSEYTEIISKMTSNTIFQNRKIKIP